MASQSGGGEEVVLMITTDTVSHVVDLSRRKRDSL